MASRVLYRRTTTRCAATTVVGLATLLLAHGAHAQDVTHPGALAAADTTQGPHEVAPTPTAAAPTDAQAELPAFDDTMEALRTQPIVQRLLAAEGSLFRAAYAAVVVHRPLERVLATLHDVNHYRDFVPHFLQSQELRRTATSQDVFVRLAVNPVLSVWARVRYHDTSLPGGATVVAGHATQGNVDRLDVRWRATPIENGAATVLEFWSLVVPALPIPLPGSILDREQANVARQGVEALRRRVEAL